MNSNKGIIFDWTGTLYEKDHGLFTFTFYKKEI